MGYYKVEKFYDGFLFLVLVVGGDCYVLGGVVGNGSVLVFELGD